MNDTITIKQLSQELKVSEQALRQWCKKNNIRKERTQGTKPCYIIGFDTEKQIRAYYSRESNERQERKQRSESNEAKAPDVSQVSTDTLQGLAKSENELLRETIEVLRQQLTVKDEQLAAKDKQLIDLTAALKSSQEQHKALTDALTAAQALHAGTIQERLTVSQDQNAEEESVSISEELLENSTKKRGFFSRLFRKDNH